MRVNKRLLMSNFLVWMCRSLARVSKALLGKHGNFVLRITRWLYGLSREILVPPINLSGPPFPWERSQPFATLGHSMTEYVGAPDHPDPMMRGKLIFVCACGFRNFWRGAKDPNHQADFRGQRLLHFKFRRGDKTAFGCGETIKEAAQDAESALGGGPDRAEFLWFKWPMP